MVMTAGRAALARFLASRQVFWPAHLRLEGRGDASRRATGGSLAFLFHSSHGGIACATALAATATTTAVLAMAKHLFLPGHKRDCRRRRLTPGPLQRGPSSYLLTATCTDAAGVAGALLLANERLARLCRGVTGGHCSREPSENETG